MKYKSVKSRAYGVLRLGLLALLVFLACDDIVQRAASDYFPLTVGNWWQYVHDNDTILVEVEQTDSTIHPEIEVFPMSFAGYVKFLVKDDRGINEYIKIIYNFSGDDYIIAEDFITRIALPMIQGNIYQDSLIDSLNIFNQWIKAKYYISGSISEYDYTSNLYSGNVYKIDIITIQDLVSPDTTISDTNSVEEYYAPNIGLVRFINEEGEYNLIDYEVQ